MNIWIIITLIAVAAAILILIGLWLAKRRRIRVDITPEENKTGRELYKVDRTFTFTQATQTPPETYTVEPQAPSIGDDATLPRDSTKRDIRDVQLPETPEPAAPKPHPTSEPTSQPTSEPAEPIAQTGGRMQRLRGRIAGSHTALGRSVLGYLGAGDLDEESWQDIEDTLIAADLGLETATTIVAQLREKLAVQGAHSGDEVKKIFASVLHEQLHPEFDRAVHALPTDPQTPAVIMMVGVNGTGKTSTTGKLARVLTADGYKVHLAAADTFRAAAASQLALWSTRAGAGITRGPEGADPSSVAFDACTEAITAGASVVIVDTAGRLHNKKNLMDELGKIKRVVNKKAAVTEVLLVLDATTGRNGVAQAKVFSEVVEVTGIVLTKLDGTAKGGIVFQVQNELGIPVKLVGLGEGPDDLAPFDTDAFISALLG